MSAPKTQVRLRYFDLRPMGPVGGRGNAVRLFLLANKLPFTNELMPLDTWKGGEKERYQKEGLSPLGHLPVLEHDGKCTPEAMAIARYMARKAQPPIERFLQHGLYGNDPDVDFETDAACDGHQEWRNAWVKAFAGDEAAKKEYNDKRDFYYGAFECYYRQRTNQDGPFMVKGDVPGFADTAIFNMARDDQLTFGEKELSPWPKLQAMYKACDAVPEIRKWIVDWEAREV